MEGYPIINPTVLLIDDDPEAKDYMQWQLEDSGFQVIWAGGGREALRQLYEKLAPDLVLLDINMPEMDGYTVCQRIREISDIPIIMLSSCTDDEAVVRSLRIGADDYVTKPYNKDILIERVRATLRRAATKPLSQAISNYNDGYLSINLKERRVIINGKILRLSPTEFKLLELLLESAPHIVCYRSLLENVWGFEYIDDIDYLRVYIWHLRNKLEPNPKAPIYIINEPSIGYRFQRQSHQP